MSQVNGTTGAVSVPQVRGRNEGRVANEAGQTLEEQFIDLVVQLLVASGGAVRADSGTQFESLSLPSPHSSDIEEERESVAREVDFEEKRERESWEREDESEDMSAAVDADDRKQKHEVTTVEKSDGRVTETVAKVEKVERQDVVAGDDRVVESDASLQQEQTSSAKIQPVVVQTAVQQTPEMTTAIAEATQVATKSAETTAAASTAAAAPTNEAVAVAATKQPVTQKAATPAVATVEPVVDVASEALPSKGEAQPTEMNTPVAAKNVNPVVAQEASRLVKNISVTQLATRNSAESAAVKPVGSITSDLNQLKGSLLGTTNGENSEKRGDGKSGLSTLKLSTSQQQKIIEKIQKITENAALKGASTSIVLHLDPAELGAMTVKLSHRSDQLFARITPESPEVEHYMRQQIPEIVQALVNSGYKAENIQVSIGQEVSDWESSNFKQMFQDGDRRDGGLAKEQGPKCGGGLFPVDCGNEVSGQDGQAAGWVA